MKVSMFPKEEMHADQAEFRLLVLISKYGRDPWCRSLTSKTDHWGELRMRRVFTINRSTTKMPRECAAVGCAELQTKGSLLSFHTFPKDRKLHPWSRRKLHPWRFELETVPIRLPCGHPYSHECFTKGYRSRIARLSLGWSLVDGRNGLFGWNLRPCQFYKEYIQTDQRTQKYILTPWHPVQRLKFKKGKNLFHKKPSRKRKGNQRKRQMYTHIFSKNELVINAEEEEEEEGRERKQTKNKWTKERKNRRHNYWTTNKYPCLV